MIHKVHAEVFPGGSGLLDFDKGVYPYAVRFDSPEEAYRTAQVVIWKATGEENAVIDITWDEL